MAMTYASLLSDLLNYLKREGDTGVEAILPTLVNNAERRLSLELKFIYNRQVVVGTLTPGDAVITKPDNWRQTMTINMGTGTGFNTRVPLFPRAYDYLTNYYWPNRSIEGTPKYYADYDVNHYLVVPTPDLAYPFEMTYFANPDFLSDTNQTNFYTENTPDLLLKACLVESPGYLKRPDFLEVWLNDYNRLLLAYNSENRGRFSDQVIFRGEGAK